jgi:NTE family protein
VTTAFVLSGGCSLGAVQVGMLQALGERGITPDLVVGTSAGALNAAFVAGHGATSESAMRLADVWTSLHGRGVFAVDVRRAVRALVGGADALCSDHRLRALLRRHLTFDDLSSAAIPLCVVATDLLSGEEVALRDGDAVEAVLASCALPGILPAVHREGRTLVDGALADNAAISQAVADGADQVYVLPSGYTCARSRPPRTPFGSIGQAATILIAQRLVADVRTYAGQVDLVVLPPPCPMTVSPLDFGHAAELIARARADTARWLDRDGGRRADPAASIALHSHPRETRRTRPRGRPAVSRDGGRTRRAG